MKPFSHDVVTQARQVNIVKYLKSIGEPLIKEGKEYRLKKHDSLTINPDNNLWKWNSKDLGGKNAIDYLETVENMTFVNAVSVLVGQVAITPSIGEAVKPAKQKKNQFVLPKPAENNRRVFAYLHKERCILPQIINHFIKCGDLYEDAEHHNAVFVGRDETGKIKFAHKRSTNTLIPKETEDGKKINNRWDVDGSDKRFGFKFIGASSKLYVFEAPIDLLSFISLRELTQEPGTWKSDNYLSLSGVADKALSQFLLTEGDKIRQITFCLDADKPGEKAAYGLSKAYAEKYRVRAKKPAVGKDFNAMLKAVAKGKYILKKLYKRTV